MKKYSYIKRERVGKGNECRNQLTFITLSSKNILIIPNPFEITIGKGEKS